MTESANHVCSFCGKKKEDVKKLIVSDAVAICNECVDLCRDLLHNDNEVDMIAKVANQQLDPRELKAFLDQYTKR